MCIEMEYLSVIDMINLHISILMLNINEKMVKQFTVKEQIKRNEYCVLKLNVNVDHKCLKFMQDDIRLFTSAMHLHRTACLCVILYDIS